MKSNIKYPRGFERFIFNSKDELHAFIKIKSMLILKETANLKNYYNAEVAQIDKNGKAKRKARGWEEQGKFHFLIFPKYQKSKN